MKTLNKKIALEQQLMQIERELKSIEKSAAFKKETAIIRSLNNLMKKHGWSKADLINLLQSENKLSLKQRRKTSPKAKRKTRALKIYKNPHNGQIVETRGGNHKILKAWKAEYSLDTIDAWLIDTKD